MWMSSTQESSTECKTKYPIILVHGAGLRDDNRFVGCWGRIPKTLRQSGAQIYFSGQDAWGSVENNARIVRSRILDILKVSNRDKVNLIAHSRGGLEARYLISQLDMGDKVASLTTLSTPHFGLKIIDFLLRAPRLLYSIISFFVNIYFKILGDKNPDFLKSFQQLSAKNAQIFNSENPDDPRVFYQSYASKMKDFWGDFILSLTYPIVRITDGDNDGLCPVNSARWGHFKGTLCSSKLKGVSHADAVDFWRMNFSGFDILKTYTNIVKDLKQRGL